MKIHLILCDYSVDFIAAFLLSLQKIFIDKYEFSKQ